LKAQRTQSMPLISPNTPNAHGHGTQFARDSGLPNCHAQRYPISKPSASERLDLSVHAQVIATVAARRPEE
jgi:hypothetical protein